MDLLLDYMAGEVRFMTVRGANRESFRGANLHRSARAMIGLCGIIWFSVFLSGEAAGFALSGMTLAALRVVPTAFVSMLACDIFRAASGTHGVPFFGRIFSRAFGISEGGTSAFLVGNLCGFPTGAREVGMAYRCGAVSSEEAERILPISSNPSPAFTVGVVGGMLGDFRVGVTLFFCVMASAILCGVIFRKKKQFYHNSGVVLGQSYNVIESIRGAGTSCIGVISCICAFAVPLGFVRKYVKFSPLKALVFSVSELAAGVDFLINEGGFSGDFRGAIPAFSLGFGGLCAMLQSRVIAVDYGISFRKFLPIKMLQGVICALLFLGVESIRNLMA